MLKLLTDEIVMDVPEPSPNLWWIVGIVAGVVALAAVLIVVLLKRRQSSSKEASK